MPFSRLVYCTTSAREASSGVVREKCEEDPVGVEPVNYEDGTVNHNPRQLYALFFMSNWEKCEFGERAVFEF